MKFKIFLFLILIIVLLGCTNKNKDIENYEESEDNEISSINYSMKCDYIDGDLGSGTILVKDLNNFKDYFNYSDGSIDITILRNESNNVCLYAYSKQNEADGTICNKQCLNELDAKIDESNRVAEIFGNYEGSYLNCTKYNVTDDDLRLPLDMLKGIPCEDIVEQA